MLANAEIAV